MVNKVLHLRASEKIHFINNSTHFLSSKIFLDQFPFLVLRTISQSEKCFKTMAISSVAIPLSSAKNEVPAQLNYTLQTHKTSQSYDLRNSIQQKSAVAYRLSKLCCLEKNSKAL